MKKAILFLCIALSTFCNAKNSTEQIFLKQQSSLKTSEFNFLKKLNLEVVSKLNFEEVSLNLKNIQNYKNVNINSIYKSQITGNYFIIVNNNRCMQIGFINNKFTIFSDVTTDMIFDSAGNGGIKIYDNFTKNNNYFTFINGKIKQNFSDDEEAVDFCKRKSTEKFQTCYNREVDAFCDGFISTVAFNTNPSIGILIAASYSCYQKATITPA